MSQFIDDLKVRLQDAQKRLQVAVQELQTAQARHQRTAQEVNSLNFLIQEETQKAAVRAAVQGPSAGVMPPTVPEQNEEKSQINKTELIREVLRQHPTGIVPNELWKAVRSEITYRPYLYSVLKRLKDKDEVFQRRGKYFLRMAPREGTDHNAVQ